MGIKPGTLGYNIKNSDIFYITKNIDKKNGGVRRISMPSYNFKKIQTWILNNVLDKISLSEYGTGFIKGKSIFIIL